MNLTLTGFILSIFSYFIVITIFLTLYYKTKEEFLISIVAGLVICYLQVISKEIQRKRKLFQQIAENADDLITERILLEEKNG